MSIMSKQWRFSVNFRIIHQQDYRRLVHKGKRLKQEHLSICYLPNSLGYLRLGISVGKKFGKAHERNRFKRSIREAFRTCPLRYAGSIDVVVLPAKKKGPLPWAAIRNELQKLLRLALARSSSRPRDSDG